jgi:hypothetical protein
VNDVGDLMAWLREQIAEVQRRAEREQAATYAAACLDANHDPRDVIAQCEAHTAILDLYGVVSDPANADRTDDRGVLLSHPIARRRMRDAVRAVGLAYQHRPGYREEWRP